MNHKLEQRKKTLSSVSMVLLMAGSVSTGVGYSTLSQAADHRDSVAADALIEGDLTDVFAFVDPANEQNVVVMLPVNPFTSPNELPSYRFAEDYLYQIKIDNHMEDDDDFGAEDLVIQAEFSGGRGPQSYKIVLGAPSTIGHINQRLDGGQELCSGRVYRGSADADPSFSEAMVTQGDVQCFVGATDDSFQTDVAQAVFRIGLNPDPVENLVNHTQDVFRGFNSDTFGPLRGRPLRADGTSGVDGFGTVNTTVIAVSLPKEMLRGTGIRDVNLTSNTRPDANPSLIGVWGTVSRPTRERFDGFTTTPQEDFAQFERMGQQLANTVWIFAQPPFGATPLTAGDFRRRIDCPSVPGDATRVLSSAELKDIFNACGPRADEILFARYVPDSLTTTPTAGSDNNTIEGRAALLTAGGFTAPGGVTGVSLFLPQVGLEVNQNRSLMRQLVFPDYMRLDLDQPTDGVRHGAGTGGNSSTTLAIGQSGVQNGRRPADDVTDIYLRLARELTDVKFPTSLLLPGIAGDVPGSGPQGDRRTLQCTQLDVDNENPQIIVPCEDARIFAVLQGTDFIERLGTDIENVANQVSDQRLLEASFPYLGLVNAVPGEPGTSEFPPQDELASETQQ